MRNAAALLRLALVVAAFALFFPALLVARRVSRRAARAIPVAFHALFLRVFAIRVRVSGTPPGADLPTLVVSNHVSWLDIPAIASRAPVSFIAKHEIAAWPIFGFLARLQRCIFIDRARKAATAEVNATVAERLAGGDVVVLFPEGTTGDGNRLLPFRSSLVGAARNALAISAGHQIRVQPLAIRYRARHGLPLTRRDRPAVAWYGDMDLVPHAAALLRAGPLDVDLAWGEPILMGERTSRKGATAAAEAEVRASLGALARLPAPDPDVSARARPGDRG